MGDEAVAAAGLLQFVLDRLPHLVLGRRAGALVHDDEELGLGPSCTGGLGFLLRR
jgi:hypothetical protein